jgi:XTP/dITP diphosphohydrolase
VRVLLATSNPGKLREVRQILPEVEWVSLAELPEMPPAVEDGDTFEANATKKALHYAARTDLPTLGEDSGLCVDALDGRPGVLSARYGGEITDPERCTLLLEEMREVPDGERGAAFRSCVVLVRGAEVLAVGEGEVRGEIARAPAGENGFGYDPVFHYHPFGCTFAQVPAERKNSVSHRRNALEALRPRLSEL